jgi:hypothetical protein
MPWQECRKVDERLRFVARLLDGEKMAVLCRVRVASRNSLTACLTRILTVALVRRCIRCRDPCPPLSPEIVLAQRSLTPEASEAPKMMVRITTITPGLSPHFL